MEKNKKILFTSMLVIVIIAFCLSFCYQAFNFESAILFTILRNLLRGLSVTGIILSTLNLAKLEDKLIIDVICLFISAYSLSLCVIF